MLNSFLRDRIRYAELRLLYDNKLQLSHPTMKAEMVKQIRQIRNEVSKKSLIDRLEQKLKQFPHSGDWARYKAAELSRVIYEAKGVPNTFAGQWRSIEFELIFKSEKIMHDFASFVRCKKYSKFVTIKDDGSLRADERGQIGKEVVVSYRSGDEQIVHDVCGWLRDKAYVNKTCGTHVHFDMRGVNYEDVQTYGARLAKAVPAMKQLLPVSRRENQYCRGTISTPDTDRYAFINMNAYNKHKTIEVRGHSGTIVAKKILNWIRLCDIVMGTKLSAKTREVTTIPDLISTYSLDSAMTEYVNSRFKRFSVTINDVEDIADDYKPDVIPAPLLMQVNNVEVTATAQV